MLAPAAVRVPGSTSNLGAGFDTVGLAVARYLTARFQPGGSRLDVRHGGTLRELDRSGDDDLLVRSFASELQRLGSSPAAGVLVVESSIPVGRGLGSSAAAVVGGLVLAWAASGAELDRELLLQRAVELEGHADNAAPALLGGLVAVFPARGGGARAVRLELARGIAFAYAAPAFVVSTAAARRALPESYPRGVATGALGRLAALLHGLGSGDPEALAAGFEDELHVPYRLPLIPGGAAALEAAAAAGAWGATISGSGSGVIAVSEPRLQGSVAAAMGEAFRRAGHDDVLAFALDPEPTGARAGSTAASVVHGSEARS